MYGKLKDLSGEATVSFTIWSSTLAKLKEKFDRGDRVIALVKPNWWTKGGSLTMQVFELKHVGIGDLLERLERLRGQLASEGLFDSERKKRLPFIPQVIGLITGKDSDAEKDVLRNARLRWPAVEFRTAYATVQGERAASDIVRAIRILDQDPEVEVIIIARGGGDFQNLLAFSDERVVRAAAAAKTPLVSAIGHEADHPLLDEVADLRASTPTDAAKRVVPDVTEELVRVRQAGTRLTLRLNGYLAHELDVIEHVSARPVLANGKWLVTHRADEITRWMARAHELADRTVERQEHRLSELRGHLRALSPQATLDRGYAIVQKTKPDSTPSVVRSVFDAPQGAELKITLANGVLDAVSTTAASESAPRDNLVDRKAQD